MVYITKAEMRALTYQATTIAPPIIPQVASSLGMTGGVDILHQIAAAAAVEINKANLVARSGMNL